jgi:hypothetical protein
MSADCCGKFIVDPVLLVVAVCLLIATACLLVDLVLFAVATCLLIVAV